MKNITWKKRMLAMIAASLVMLTACGAPADDGGDTDTGTDTSTSTDTDDGAGEGDDSVPTSAGIEEGADTNNGRPYNLTPVAYDSRNDEYLNGINATVLPVVDEPLEINVWMQFSSTVIQSMADNLAFQEMEERTGVSIVWEHPPVGSEQNSYNLSVNSNTLPHLYMQPPAYPGGPAQAVSEGVYLDQTPYYDDGLMPNLEYIMNSDEQFYKDIVDDEGRILGTPHIDIVPSHPWQGAWVREDTLNDLGLDAPVTIEDWDEMLRAMQDANGGGYVLGFTPGRTGTDYVFAGAYGASYLDFINVDGEVKYGSIEDGYLDYLTLMNTWYNDGILDPDFTTITNTDYDAKVANGSYQAFTLAYGSIGQAKITGAGYDEDFKLIPVTNPVVNEGDPVHLAQTNGIVRGGDDYLTTQIEVDGIAEDVVKWKDYWHSQDGGDLLSYGVEGVSYEWNDEGTVNWIYEDLETNPDADFWTTYPAFKLHVGGYLRDSTSYEMEQEVWDCIDLWSTHEVDWVMPDSIAHTPDEADELADIMVDVETYIEEATLAFITGQRPLSEFDAYVSDIMAMGIEDAVAIKQAALDRYNAR